MPLSLMRGRGIHKLNVINVRYLKPNPFANLEKRQHRLPADCMETYESSQTKTLTGLEAF